MVERYRIFAFTTFYRADSSASPLRRPYRTWGLTHLINPSCTQVATSSPCRV